MASLISRQYEEEAMFSLRIEHLGRLFWKLFFAIWLSQLTAVIGVGAVFWMHRYTKDHEVITTSVSLHGLAVREVAVAAALLRAGGIAALRDLELETQHEFHPPVYAVNEQGIDILERPLSLSDWENVQQLAREGRYLQQIRTVQENDGHRYILFIPEHAQQFNLKRPQHPPEGPFPPDATLLPVLPVIMGLLTSLLISAVLAWYLAKPIRYLRAGFESLAKSQFDTQVSLAMGRRRDELADLGREFDRMAHQITTLMAAQRHLLHDVSHELRSPMARLQAAIGLARQQPEKIDTSLDRIELEAGRLDELVGEVLTLSRLEAGVTNSVKEEIDLTELLDSVIEDARFEASAKNVAVNYLESHDIRINADAELIHRALENILRNAVKYTPPGLSIQVEIDFSLDGRQVSLSISDQGPGVADEQLTSVFEPFFRGSGNSQIGFGLGLAIARRAVEVHGGSITVRNKPEGGFQIELILPIGLG
jgi:two-component system OmpR family sensor kinase